MQSGGIVDTRYLHLTTVTCARVRGCLISPGSHPWSLHIEPRYNFKRNTLPLSIPEPRNADAIDEKKSKSTAEDVRVDVSSRGSPPIFRLSEKKNKKIKIKTAEKESEGNFATKQDVITRVSLQTSDAATKDGSCASSRRDLPSPHFVAHLLFTRYTHSYKKKRKKKGEKNIKKKKENPPNSGNGRK
ncbi:hypothetical protein PUN28_005076 [Cardiocondyla obscurior]|uniref:Uncharacterized protein n=1 Tax=Cardiocondyla obscurior TaxID=286306 RepID=A0AAW2GJ63_9HYME